MESAVLEQQSQTSCSPKSLRGGGGLGHKTPPPLHTHRRTKAEQGREKETKIETREDSCETQIQEKGKTSQKQHFWFWPLYRIQLPQISKVALHFSQYRLPPRVLISRVLWSDLENRRLSTHLQNATESSILLNSQQPGWCSVPDLCVLTDSFIFSSG